MARRYLFARSKNNAINIITIIAAVGVVAGSMALFVALSGFAGLRDFSLQFADVYDPDLKVLPATGKTITIDEKTEGELAGMDGVAHYSKVIEERVLLHFDEKNAVAYIKGVDDNYLNVNKADSMLLAGQWFEASRSQAVIGVGLSDQLGLGVFDYSGLLEIYVPKPGTGQITDPSKAFSSRRALVSGVYGINEDLNDEFVFTSIGLARDLLDLPEKAVSAVELKLEPGVGERAVTTRLREIFGGTAVIKNRIQLNDALHKMLNTENLAVYLICTLIVIIALFNVVGSIIMMIIDKGENIRTLFNLGAEQRKIRKVFLLQGSLMTILGGLVGLLLGLALVWLQLRFGLVMITQTLPYPVKLELQNIWLVVVTIGSLGFVASAVASRRVVL